MMESAFRGITGYGGQGMPRNPAILPFRRPPCAGSTTPGGSPAPRHHEDQAGRQIEGRHPGDPDRPPGPLRRRRDPKAAVRASGQDGASRKEPPGRQAGDGTVDHPGAGGREAGSRVRFRPASGTGEPTHPDPAEAGGRATDHGTWTDTDTDTGVWLTACRSPRRSLPPGSEGRSWRGATGWPEKKPGAALRGRRHSFVAGTDVHHPTDRSLPMDAARCMVRDVSRACGGLGRPAGGGRNTFGKSSGKATSGWPRHGSPTPARGTWRRRSGWR